MKKILIYNSGGGLGDSIQLIPLILSLQNHYKRCKFFYLGAHQNHFHDKLKEYDIKIETLQLDLKYFGFRWWHLFFAKKKFIDKNESKYNLIIDLQSKIRNSLILKTIPHIHFYSMTYKNIFSTNMFGTFLFVREVSKIMIRKRYGRIINFSTVAAGIRLEGEATYAASKSAIANFTQTVAKELGEFGITVNAIAPTPIKTDLIINVPVDKINKLFDHQAIKRFGEFKDIQNLIDFFIKDESEFITGQVIYLGGVNG